MPSRVTPFENLTVDALAIPHKPKVDETVSSVTTFTVTDQKSARVYFAFRKRAFTRTAVPSYLSPNGEASKKHVLDLRLTKSEKQALARLDAWAIQEIVKSGYYTASSAEIVKGKYKPILKMDDTHARLGVFKDVPLHLVQSDSQGVLSYEDCDDFNVLVEGNEGELIVSIGCIWLTPESCGITILLQRGMIWIHETPFFDYMNVQLVKKHKTA
eukprot:122558-Pleurochrysis_carterae.AAC.1